MRIAFGTDEATEVPGALVAHLRGSGHDVVDVATGAAWPEVGRTVAGAVADGTADMGIVCCFTGTGVAMAANKVAGVRAALCTDAATAAGARRWNDANVLALGLRLTTAVTATEMADAFVATGFDRDEADAVDRVEAATRARSGR